MLKERISYSEAKRRVEAAPGLSAVLSSASAAGYLPLDGFTQDDESEHGPTVRTVLLGYAFDH